MNFGRYATTIVNDGNGVIFVNEYINVGTISAHRFINGIIDHLIHQMMKTFFINISDIHRRTLTYGLQTLQNLNAVC